MAGPMLGSKIVQVGIIFLKSIDTSTIYKFDEELFKLVDSMIQLIHSKEETW